MGSQFLKESAARASPNPFTKLVRLAGSPPAPELGRQRGRGHIEEGGLNFCGHSLGQHGLARARGPEQQHALWTKIQQVLSFLLGMRPNCSKLAFNIGFMGVLRLLEGARSEILLRLRAHAA